MTSRKQPAKPGKGLDEELLKIVDTLVTPRAGDPDKMSAPRKTVLRAVQRLLERMDLQEAFVAFVQQQVTFELRAILRSQRRECWTSNAKDPETGLSARGTALMTKLGLSDVAQFSEYSADELLAMSNVGKKTVDDIRATLLQMGEWLKGE